MGRVPGAFLEGALIVFAVLVALGVDEYWETREERGLAAIALERIGSEVLSNTTDLLDNQGNNLSLMTDLEAALGRAEIGEPLGLTGVSYEVSLLASDAWQTAQVTRAVHFMDFDQVGRISGAYRVQQFYLDRQALVIDDVAGLGGGVDVLDSFRSILRGLEVTLAVQCELLLEYDRLLSDLTPGHIPDDALPADCD